MSVMKQEKQYRKLDKFIPGLEGEDCFIEPVESGIRLTFYDGQIFDIFEVGGWVQVSAVILSEEEMNEITFIEELREFVLGLNSRCLGCRFAMEPDGSLLLVEDIPLERVSENMINEAIDSISYVDYVFYDMIVDTGNVGLSPSEGEIDTVITKKENSYDRYH